MRDRRIWPTACPTFGAMRFGLMLLVSVYRKLGEAQYLDAAEHLVAEVERVLGRRRRIRISEAPDRDGQCFHYLAIWLYALGRLGEIKPELSPPVPSLLIRHDKGNLAGSSYMDRLHGCASVRQASAVGVHSRRGDRSRCRILELGLVDSDRAGPRLIHARPRSEDRTSARAARAGHDGERR